MKNRNGLKGDLLWLSIVVGVFLLGASGVVTNHRGDTCGHQGDLITCESFDDAAQRGAIEARESGRAGACIHARHHFRHFGGEYYSISLTDDADCWIDTFVAAEVAR